MPAAITTNIQQVGAPLGTLAITNVNKDWEGICVNRKIAYVQFYAIDTSNASAAFKYAITSALLTSGTFTIVPAGSMIILPFFETQSYWFQMLGANSDLYGTCVG